MNPAVNFGHNSFFITFLASFLIWLMYAGLLVLWIIDGKIRKERALHALLASFVAWGLAEMIKNLFPTLRPFQTNGYLPLTITTPSDSAFPSGHTAAAFGLATGVFLHHRKSGTIFLTAAFFVGLGRVLGNVHSFLDIIGGAFAGILVAFVLERLHVDRLLK